MGLISLNKLDFNGFWEKTPTTLKYILVIAIIVGATYFFVTKKVYNGQLEELKRTEQGITMTYDLVQKFEKYKYIQNMYNVEYSRQLRAVYMLVNELKDNTNNKFNIMLKSGSKNKDDIIDKLQMLNVSFDKISNAYRPQGTEDMSRKEPGEMKINGIKKEE
jgi:hypothetical protein